MRRFTENSKVTGERPKCVFCNLGMSVSLAERDKLCELLEIILEIPNYREEDTERQWMAGDAYYQHSGEKQRIKNDNTNNPVSQLFWLLRDCLLSHRWQEVLRIFQGVTTEISDTLLTQWRVGCELFMSSGGGNVDLMQQFIAQLKRMPHIDTQEVILEFVIYLIKHRHLDDALHTLQNIPQRHKSSSYDPVRLQPFLKGYQGLIHYMQWLDTRATLQKSDDNKEATPILATEAATSAEGLMATQAERAIKCFTFLMHTPGVWDMFVDKHVKLLEFYKRFEEAENVLLSNCDTNPSNPNAHRYLLSYYKRHNADTNSVICVLQKIVQLIPSDPAVLDLVCLLKDTDLEGCVPLMFNMLDYSCWQHDTAAWTLLEEILVDLYYRQSVTTVREAWCMREQWWPPYHFHAGHVRSDDRRLLIAKATVTILTMGPENHFNRLVEEKFGQSSRQLEAATLHLKQCKLESDS